MVLVSETPLAGASVCVLVGHELVDDKLTSSCEAVERVRMLDETPSGKRSSRRCDTAVAHIVFLREGGTSIG